MQGPKKVTGEAGEGRKCLPAMDWHAVLRQMTTRVFTSILDTRFWCVVFRYLGDKRLKSTRTDLT